MTGKLHTPAEVMGLTPVLWRIGVLFAIILVTVTVLYFEGGLIDTRSEEAPGILDCLYFTMVTITTVGYGDIVPESTFARMVDTFFLTPMRFIVFVLFVGIAYQLSIKQLHEGYRMKRAVSKLQDHIIVCGYGETGRACVDELLLQGTSSDSIVVLEIDPRVLDDAVSREVIAVLGDATREKVLKSVALERAKHVLISPGRDDSAVLIALTVRDLNPSAHIVVECHETENTRLLERSGADTIVSPSSAGGNLMAAATRKPHIVATMQDILTVGGTLRMDERPVKPEEVGKHPSELPGIAAVRVYRGERHFNPSELPRLQTGDILVFVRELSGENHVAPETV